MPQKSRATRPVIAVTGSAGKTTTKEMLASILQRRWNIFKTKGNWNSYRHTARYARKISSAHRAVVLELGMIKCGDIRRHCEAIRPGIGIITNVGTAHIGNVGGSIYDVARVKSELIRHMKQPGTLILNADDRNSRLLQTKGFSGPILTVGIRNRAHFRARRVRYRNGGMAFDVELDGRLHRFFVPIYGEHNVYNALFAIAAARRLGFSVEEIRRGLASYRKLKRRLTVYHANRGVRIIDDTFSANPHAVKAALDVLSRVGRGRKIAVLGSMLQMGSYARTGHRSVGRYLAQKDVDYLFAFGTPAKWIREGAVAVGFPASRAVYCPDRRDLHRRLRRVVRPGSTVLVKGSHGLQMDKTVTFLRRLT